MEFISVPPDKVKSIPASALFMLEKSCRESPVKEYTVTDILTESALGNGQIVLCQDDEIRGIFYYEVAETLEGKVMNVVMLGGESVKSWAKELQDYCVSLGYDRILFLSRKGWGKIFPDFKPVATLYSL